MDSLLIITLGGIILTAIFGFWTIILYLKKKYPCKIIFVAQNIIGLYDSLVKNLPELTVLYNGKNVEENLFLLRGAFLNNGKKDITEAMVEKELTLHLPKRYKILTAKVTSEESGISVSSEIVDHQKIRFKLGLFRVEEFFKIEILIEDLSTIKSVRDSVLEAEINIFRNIYFTHRIADTRKVELMPIDDKVLNPSEFNISDKGILLLTIILSIGFISYVLNLPIRPTLSYYKEYENRKVNVLFTPNFDNTVTLTGVILLPQPHPAFKQVLNMEEYKKFIGKCEITVVKEIDQPRNKIFIGMVTFMLCILLYISIRRIYQIRRLNYK